VAIAIRPSLGWNALIMTLIWGRRQEIFAKIGNLQKYSVNQNNRGLPAAAGSIGFSTTVDCRLHERGPRVVVPRPTALIHVNPTSVSPESIDGRAAQRQAPHQTAGGSKE
jgi:hypothetical protein